MGISLSQRSTFKRSTLVAATLLLIAITLPRPVWALGGSKTPFIGDDKIGGFWGFFGVDAGWNWLVTRVSGEANKQGLDGGASLGITFYRKVILWELAGRFNYKDLAGTRSGGLSIRQDSLSFGGEFGVRFRFGELFQAGPFFQFMLGQDLSYKPNTSPILSNESTRANVMAAGFSWMYETRRGPTPMRVGVRFTKYLDVPNRSLHGVMVTYQIGFRITNGPRPKFIYNTRDE
ncbi:MAG: hypothetical protein KDD39_08915 [Bdellovibrionales bacterium]|nr:hypothetical protein [Bdellovibrionales bacterium]